MTKWMWAIALGLLCLNAGRALAGPATEGAAVGVWTMDEDAAKALAAEKRLPLLYNFTGSDWCGWCMLMDKQVFSQAAWANFATQNLVLVWVDFPEDESLVPEKFRARNQALGGKYGVNGYPTYIVIDADGKTELGRLGADRGATPASFIGQVEGVLENRAETMAAMAADMGEEKGAAYRRNLTRLRDARAERTKIEAESMAAMKRLDAEIEELEAAVEADRVAWKLSKLSAEQQAAYKAADAAYLAKRDELKQWLSTQPERSDENRAKFDALTGQLSDLEQARNRALKGP